MLMRQIAEEMRRPRGRPPIRSDEETRGLMIEAARQEFQANGYAATCMKTTWRKSNTRTHGLSATVPQVLWTNAWIKDTMVPGASS